MTRRGPTRCWDLPCRCPGRCRSSPAAERSAPWDEATSSGGEDNQGIYGDVAKETWDVGKSGVELGKIWQYAIGIVDIASGKR